MLRRGLLVALLRAIALGRDRGPLGDARASARALGRASGGRLGLLRATSGALLDVEIGDQFLELFAGDLLAGLLGRDQAAASGAPVAVVA